MLKQVFTDLVKVYSDEATALRLWNEIIINYNDAFCIFWQLKYILWRKKKSTRTLYKYEKNF